MKILQVVIDDFYYARQFCMNCIVFALVRIFGPEMSFGEVKRVTYDGKKYENINLDNSDINSLLPAAKDCLAAAFDRRSSVIDKSKSLLTLSTLLLTAAGILVTKFLTFEKWWIQMMFLAAVIMLVGCIILLLAFMAVGPESVISLDQQHAELSETDFKKCLFNDVMHCESKVGFRTDYMVDLYKAARFYYLFSFFLLVALFFMVFPAKKQEDENTKVLRSIKESIVAVQGRPGKDGTDGKDGEPGAPGIQGFQGMKGDPGSPAVMDEEKIIRELIADPRMRKLLEETIKSRP